MEIINSELKKFNIYLLDSIKNIHNEITPDIVDFIESKSKQIRPVLIFLLAKSLNYDIDDKIITLMAATELIHNATLIHDDIIDNSDLRRGKISLNKKIGNNLSVLSGDLLLAIALNLINKINKPEIQDIFSKAMLSMCSGEINQHFSYNKVPSLAEYINKSESKTSELFIAASESLCIIKNTKEKENIINFARNFGIAFQIKDDLNNLLNTDKTKPSMTDIYSGIYTAPVIFLNNIKGNIEKLEKEEIISLLNRNQEVFEKTVKLITEYSNKAIASLSFIRDNQYKNKLIELCENLYKAG